MPLLMFADEATQLMFTPHSPEQAGIRTGKQNYLVRVA